MSSIKFFAAAAAAAAAALALSGVAWAGNVAIQKDYRSRNLGHLTQFPAQFAGSDASKYPSNSFSNMFIFTIDAPSNVIGSVGQLLGAVSFEQVQISPNSPFYGDLDDTVHPVEPWELQNWAPVTPAPTPTGNGFQFNDLLAGEYILFIKGSYPTGSGLYSGSIYATPAVPEPGSLALVFAGLSVAALLSRRRKTC